MSLLPTLFNRDLFQFPEFMPDFKQLQNLGSDQGLTVYEEGNNIVVEAHMPGLKPEEIKAGVNNGMLKISGKKKEEEKDKNRNFYRKSVRSYAFSVALPDQIDANLEPEASYEDGVLKVTLQKAKSSQEKNITIKNNKNNKNKKPNE